VVCSPLLPFHTPFSSLLFLPSSFPFHFSSILFFLPFSLLLYSLLPSLSFPPVLSSLRFLSYSQFPPLPVLFSVPRYEPHHENFPWLKNLKENFETIKAEVTRREKGERADEEQGRGKREEGRGEREEGRGERGEGRGERREERGERGEGRGGR
jgi:hypothetical protein